MVLGDTIGELSSRLWATITSHNVYRNAVSHPQINLKQAGQLMALFNAEKMTDGEFESKEL